MESPWKIYVNKEVRARFDGGEVYGFMKQPNLDGEYVDFLPHVVFTPSGDCYLDRETPRRISLRRIFGGNPDFTPLEKGGLLKIVEKNKD
jgi:hypothetical protein